MVFKFLIFLVVLKLTSALVQKTFRVGVNNRLRMGSADHHTLVLIRHGESTWNLQNRFTGWADVPLSDQGITEAKDGGRYLNSLNSTLEYDSYYKCKYKN